MSSVMRFDEWQDSDGNPVFNGAGGVSPGGLIAVKSAIRTAPEVFSAVAGQGDVAVGGLSITHEVADPANRLIISALLSGANGTTQLEFALAVHDGTELIAIGDEAGSRTRVTAGGPTGVAFNGAINSIAASFVHTPGAGSKTYTVRALNTRDDTQTLFINRTPIDNNAANRVRSVSSLVIQEVAV